MPEDKVGIKEYWDKQHREDNPEMLSGNSASNEWTNLGVTDLIIPGKTVLNIGVGKGYGTIGLVEKGLDVYALDISDLALDKIRDKVKGCWLAENIKELPLNTFDLVLSHLVTQHLYIEMIREQITEVIRSLKPDGIFAMQFAMGWWIESVENIFDAATRGGQYRTIATMDRLVRECGGDIVWLKKIFDTDAKWKVTWYSIHIKKTGRTGGFEYAARG